MQGVSKESMQNLGCGGYLIYKTIQPYSLHSNSLKINQNYQETNLQLFLNKKFSEMRNQLTLKKIPKQLLQTACLRVKTKQLAETQEQKNLTPQVLLLSYQFEKTKRVTHSEIINGLNQSGQKTLAQNHLENQLQNSEFLDQNSKDLAEKIKELNILNQIDCTSIIKKKQTPLKKPINFEKVINQLVHQRISNEMLKRWFIKF